MKNTKETTAKQTVLRLDDVKIKELLSAVLSLKNINETVNFFHDLLTPRELKTISNRWMAARYLSDGKSYVKISEKMNISTTTVTRVARSLREGSGGLKLILKRIVNSSFRA